MGQSKDRILNSLSSLCCLLSAALEREPGRESVFLKGSSVYSFGRTVSPLFFFFWWLCRCLPHPRGGDELGCMDMYVEARGHPWTSFLSICPPHCLLMLRQYFSLLTSLKLTIRQWWLASKPRTSSWLCFSSSKTAHVYVGFGDHTQILSPGCSSVPFL